jgi:hypothetical protein
MRCWVEKTEKIEIMDENAGHIYSNLISFNVNPEEVCMGMGIREIKDANHINIQTYVHLTIPHFLRFADAVNKQVSLLVEKGVISKEPEQ